MKRWTTFWNYNAGCGAYNDNQTAGAASGTGYARKLLLAASLCLIVLSGCNPRTTGEVGREPTVGDLLGMTKPPSSEEIYRRESAWCTTQAAKPGATLAMAAKCLNEAERAAVGGRTIPAAELYYAKRIAAAEALDAGKITEAQFNVAVAEAKQAAIESMGRGSGISAARDDNLLRAGLQMMATPPARPSAPLGIDCSVTPGSLGRNVSCW